MDTSRFSKKMQKAIGDAVAYLIKHPEAKAYTVSKETGVTQYIARKLIRERQTPVDNLRPSWAKITEQDIRDAKAALDQINYLDPDKEAEIMADIAKGPPLGVQVLLDAAHTFDEREKEYGKAGQHWVDVARVWTSVTGHPITPTEAVRMMIALKLMRLKNNPFHKDSLIDIAGYTAVLAEAVAMEKE